MHPQPAFQVRDEALLVGHLARHPFAVLAAAPEGRLLIAHAPLLVRRVEGVGLVLDFHLSRGNALAPHLARGFSATTVSLGPDAYISPDWYADKDQAPTWNYLSVEAEGRAARLPDEDLVRLLDDLSEQEEARLAPKAPWTRDKMSPGRFDAMLKGIIGGRLTVSRLEGTFKTWLTKAPDAQASVRAALADHPFTREMEVLGWLD